MEPSSSTHSENLLHVSLPSSSSFFDHSLSSSSSSFTPHLSLSKPILNNDPPESLLLSDSHFIDSSSGLPVFDVSDCTSKAAVPSSLLTHETLLSHPNYQPHTPVWLRLLTDIESIAPQSSSSVLPPPTHAHLSHTLSGSFPLHSTSLLEPAVSSSQPTDPITADFSLDNLFTYQEALRSSDVAQWVCAMIEEINSLKESKT